MVFKSSMQNADLVTPDYYEKELIPANHRRICQNRKTISKSSGNSTTDKEIKTSLPTEMNNEEVKATVLLYCPSDKRKDIKKDITVKGAVLVIPINRESMGAYDLKINWQANGITYYHEQKLFLQ